MIGGMRERVTFQEESRVDDNGGGYALTWANIADTPTMYAEVVPLSAGEALRYRQLEATVTHKVTIRYRDDITSAMRISHGAKVYNVRSLLNRDARGRFLEMLVEEGVAT